MRVNSSAQESREARSSPPAHRGARVIGTDALRIVLILREPSDGQECKQDSEDDPNISAHQSSPAAGSYPADTQRVKESPERAGASSEG
jgi:hypothetical protein